MGGGGHTEYHIFTGWKNLPGQFRRRSRAKRDRATFRVGKDFENLLQFECTSVRLLFKAPHGGPVDTHPTPKGGGGRAYPPPKKNRVRKKL